MSRWFKINSDLLNDRACQSISPAQFRKRLTAALRGGDNEFSPFLRAYNGRPSATEWSELRTAAFERDDFTCQYCGKRGGRLECDHIIPVSRGGSHDMENLATACKPCNRSKRAKTPEEWLQ